ncbi:hypothetical protein [Cryobacterium sp. GrIS_2_6]|uniref:hypothetical protein n=1 Tax=Cryobacterium sp. GrIS_2_6 TaxID=3162785 RepID=UPI002E00E59F|nr:formylmethanofuran:tetrahydromethanopterin formyltransferase [Cryobacterium psychrotolerans]
MKIIPYVAMMASNNRTGPGASALVYPDESGHLPRLIENPAAPDGRPILGIWGFEGRDDDKKFAWYRETTVPSPRQLAEA